MNAVQKLLSISSDEIGLGRPTQDFQQFLESGLIPDQLGLMLHEKNGFYAFESALHVFPTSSRTSDPTLIEWNAEDFWRYEYGGLGAQAFFFAEDAFGNQFAVVRGSICTFDAETGDLTELADTIEGWADQILGNYATLTGYPLLHSWQERNGVLSRGSRLMPKIPFVLGGSYSVENVYSLESVRGMKSRGNLARQLKDLPEGAKVEFRIVD